MAVNHMFKIVYSNLVDLGGLAPIFGITKIACALICLREDGCSSFFYHADEMNCVPSLTRHFNSRVLDHHKGHQYYVACNLDCGRYWELFNGTWYYFENKKLTHEAAEVSIPILEKNCLEKGGYLADIEDDAENALFVTLSQRGSFWVGLKKEDNTWIWRDGSALPFKYWASGEPKGGSCVQLRKKAWGLDDTDCTRYKYSLCEK